LKPQAIDDVVALAGVGFGRLSTGGGVQVVEGFEGETHLVDGALPACREERAVDLGGTCIEVAQLGHGVAAPAEHGRELRLMPACGFMLGNEGVDQRQCVVGPTVVEQPLDAADSGVEGLGLRPDRGEDRRCRP
jgi:hypothetical protein